MNRRILGLLAGSDLPFETVKRWCLAADTVYGADSGAELALEAGVKPVVVGDMDSYASSREGLRVVEDPDQDTTDCDKLLALLSADGHKVVTLCGAEGDRLDHVLGNLASCVRAVQNGMEIRLVLRVGFGVFVTPGCPLRREGLAGQGMSLIPLLPSTVTTEGLQWELNAQRLSLEGLSSISNVGLGDVTVSVTEGALLVITSENSANPW
ncbi:MAG: thiamine diphosphokinase [Fimbriimonadaceae bacterium]|jgi:thiamine pyrophosphokinase|nr:thiamine diphosphokinase [Fimbriimonadaceae bacterium]